jgi:alpha-tubulin suppressor-like RCC1 family protein
MAIKTDGSLWRWGEFYSHIGRDIYYDGDVFLFKKNAKPKKLMSGVASAAIGIVHYLAVKDDGSLWAWGYNGRGELGDGTRKDRKYPVKVMDGVAMAAAGASHSLALKEDGTLWAWGDNKSYQLGVHTEEDFSTEPVKVMDHVTYIAAAGLNSLAIKEDGSLWTWGNDQSFQLGIGLAPYESPDGEEWLYERWPYRAEYYKRSLPHMVLTRVKEVAAIESNVLAKRTDGSLWQWGLGSYTMEEKWRPHIARKYSRPVLIHR